MQTSAKPKETTANFQLVSLKKLEDSPDNPNVQNDAVFDKLVESIKEDGFDEPVIVTHKRDDKGNIIEGRFVIVSGHHRANAAKVAGLAKIPVVVKDWNDDRRRVELVRRNVLRGNLDPIKFTKLFDAASKGKDPALIRAQMGFVSSKQFDQYYQRVRKQLNSEQRKKLDEAKEDIKTVDDLSSVLNTIFKESGSTLDYGYMVFSFGGKDHHYITVDEETNALLAKVEKKIKLGRLSATDVFRRMFETYLEDDPGFKSKPAIKAKPSK